MPREIDVTDILAFINRATDLSSLASINVAVGVRRRQLGDNPGNLASPFNPTPYQIGQIVKISQRIRPRYLAGLTVTIINVNRTTVSVRVPTGLAYGRFSGCPRVRLPISLIAGVVNAHAPASVRANNGEDDGLVAEREALMMEGRQR